MKMTKREMIVKIAEKTKLTQSNVALVVQNVFSCISDELLHLKNIEFRNFGVFEIKVRKARKGRNPNKPEKEVLIPDRLVIKFRPGKILKGKIDKINPKKIK